MEKLKNFEEVKENIDENWHCCNKNLLLGNGFTRECAKIVNLEEKLNSEYIIEEVLKNLCDNNKQSLEDFMYEIEKRIIKQIYNSLPKDKINLLKKNKMIIEFLKYFNNYYTLNYDDILYRLLMKLNFITKDKYRCTDGFFQKFWEGYNPQNTYYLHGAFHFMKNENKKIEKIESKGSSELNEIIEQNWNKGKKSHVIFSSNYKRKELEINDSEYLKHCFCSFKNMSGILVTMGVSFGQSDTHIVEAIKENGNLKKIYLGWHYESDLEHYKEIFKEIPEDKISYYPTENIFKD